MRDIRDESHALLFLAKVQHVFSCYKFSLKKRVGTRAMFTTMSLLANVGGAAHPITVRTVKPPTRAELFRDAHGR